MEKNKLVFKCTCRACPEQYDVFYNDKQVAYVRLRHGYLYCDVPDYNGDTIYEANPQGEGCFWDNEEREYYLNIIKDKIVEYYTRRNRYEDL